MCLTTEQAIKAVRHGVTEKIVLGIDPKIRQEIDSLKIHFGETDDAAIIQTALTLLHLAKNAREKGMHLAEVGYSPISCGGRLNRLQLIDFDKP